MRGPLILIGLLALLFTGLMALGGRDTGENAPRDRPPREDYEPGGFLAALGEAAAGFAPPLRLAQARFELRPGIAVPVAVPRAEEGHRVGRFEIAAGRAVRLTYRCNPPPPGREDPACEQDLCLVAPGAPRPPACPARPGPEQAMRLVVGAAGGTLRLEAIGAPAVAVLR